MIVSSDEIMTYADIIWSSSSTRHTEECQLASFRLLWKHLLYSWIRGFMPMTSNGAWVYVFLRHTS